MALAAHGGSRHHGYPPGAERRRRFPIERFLADRTHCGFLIARCRDTPVGMLACSTERLYYTDVTVVSCLSFYVMDECRRTLLGGRVAV